LVDARNIAPAGLVALVCLATLGACGQGPEKKETTMTPDEAYAETRQAVAEVLETLSPGSSGSIGDPDTRIPCGGPGGNEFTKIRAGLTGKVASPVDDPKDALAKARARLTDLGWTVDKPNESGGSKFLPFGGTAGSGEVRFDPDGTVLVSADSVCLNNPNKDDPFPEITPRSSAPS